MMKASTRCAIAGCLLGLVLAGTGLAADEMRSRKLAKLQGACELANASAPRGGNAQPSSFEAAEGSMVCDPYELERAGVETVGLQRAILEAKRSPTYGANAVLAGLWIAALLAVPYLWYAFLRRLRELSDAVRARPPSP